MDKLDFLRQNGVDVDTGIQNMMDAETYNEILDDFYNSIDDEMNKINNFKQNSDMSNYAISVYAMKSNARSFGFNKLGQLAYNHEMASKQGDINYVNENYNELVNEILNTKKIIEQYKNL